MIDIEKKIDDLSKSKFRNSFHLNYKMKLYCKEKGYKKIKEHAYNFINERLKSKNPINDGKQTPMKGHPVFIAQHACACCCRSCLYKWHHIEKNKELTENEINYIVCIILKWIEKEINNESSSSESKTK